MFILDRRSWHVATCFHTFKHLELELFFTMEVFLHLKKRHIRCQLMEEGVILCDISALVGELNFENESVFCKDSFHFLRILILH